MKAMITVSFLLSVVVGMSFLGGRKSTTLGVAGAIPELNEQPAVAVQEGLIKLPFLPSDSRPFDGMSTASAVRVACRPGFDFYTESSSTSVEPPHLEIRTYGRPAPTIVRTTVVNAQNVEYVRARVKSYRD